MKLYNSDTAQQLELDDETSYEQLIEFINQNLNETDPRRPLQIKFNKANSIDFKPLIAFSRQFKLNLQLLCSDADEEFTKSLDMLNARIKRAYNSSQKDYDSFKLSENEQGNQIILNLNPTTNIAFSADNEIFQQLQAVLNQLEQGSSLIIVYSQETQLDLNETNQLINFLSTNKMAFHIQLAPKNEDQPSLEVQGWNQKLDDYSRYSSRKKGLDEDSLKKLSNPFQEASGEAGKVRRTKQLLNRGVRIQAQLQHQVHHQQHHAVEQSQEVHQEQENQQQQFQNRQNQIEQQQQRMANVNQQSNEVNVDALGKLIHRDNLADLVSAKHPQEEIEALWFGLVGQYANYVDDPRNRITHVPEATFWLLLNNKEQFSQGIHFDNLPNGFGFTVIQEEAVTRSIFYFDKRLEKSFEHRKDTFLAPTLTKESEPITKFGTVGQFYPFFNEQQPVDFNAFCQNNSATFNLVFHPQTNSSLKARKEAMIELLGLDNPAFVANKAQLTAILEDFSHKNLNGLRAMLLKHGSENAVQFLTKVEQLKRSNQYDLFKTIFLDRLADWQDLISSKGSRQEELTTFEGLDYLAQLPVNNKLWWQSMLTQHAAANKKCDFADLINAQKFFLDQVKAIDPLLQLPTPCLLKNINNMKVAYDRLLYVLKKAINPIEQARYLEQLDWGPQGVICGASRLGPYILLTEDMNITPTSGITDWSKYAQYIPTYNPKEWKPSKGGDNNSQEDFLRVYHFQRLSVEQVPEAYLSPRGFYTDVYRHRTPFTIINTVYANDNFLSLLDRDSEGFLRVMSMKAFFDHGPKMGQGTRIDDPQIQDDAIFTRFNKLAYDIDLSILIDFSRKLSLFHNAEKYFYRYVGAQPFIHDFKVYRKLIEDLRMRTLSADPQQNIVLKKELLPLLAASTTGPRALRSSADLFMDLAALFSYTESKGEHLLDRPTTEMTKLHDLVELSKDQDLAQYNNSYLFLRNQSGLPQLYFINNGEKNAINITNWEQFIELLDRKQRHKRIETIDLSKDFILSSITRLSGHNPYTGILSTINEHLCTVTIKPTLQEISALIKLCVSHKATDSVFTAISKHEETIYQAIIYLSQHQTLPDSHQIQTVMSFANNLTTANSKQKNALLLISSLINKEEWPLLDELIEAIAIIDNPMVLEHLTALLQIANVPESHSLLSIADVKKLFTELATIKKDDPALFDTVHTLTLRTLPNLRLTDLSVAKSISSLIQMIAPLVDTLENLIHTNQDLLDNFNLPDNQFLKDNEIKIIISQINEKLIARIELLNTKLRALNENGKTDEVKKVLLAIQNLIAFFDDPLKDITLPGSPIAAGVVHVAVNNFIVPIKKKVLEELSKHLIETLSLQIASSVTDLHIDDKLLNKPAEKQVLLSTQLNDFLISKIPAIKGKELALEINAIFKEQEQIEALLISLQHWQPKQRRDLLLVELYRSGYFKKTPLVPGLADLTNLVTIIRTSTQKDVQRILRLALQAYDKGIEAQSIKLVLDSVTDERVQLTEKEFFLLLETGIQTKANGLNVIHLLKIKQSLQQDESGAKRQVFAHLLTDCAKQFRPETTAQLDNIQQVIAKTPNEINKLVMFINFIFNQQRARPLDDINSLVSFLLTEGFEQRSILLTMLQGSCWEVEAESPRPVNEQLALLKDLLKLEPTSLEALAKLYSQRPCPGFTSLRTACSQDTKQFSTWIKQYELDPFGNREKIKAQYSMTGIESYAADIKTLMDNQQIPVNKQNELIKGFAYVIGVSDKLCLAIKGALKPINQFTQNELSSYYQLCLAKAQANPKDKTAKLEALAIFCEVMFRTTGKYPYHSQILSALCTLYFEGSALLQIPTGQGKSISNGLLAALSFSFPDGQQLSHVSVTSRNKLLIYRDYKASVDFYNYLDIPVTFVTSTTEKNYFEKPTIIYTTVADDSLYRSKLKMVDNITFPDKANQVVISDEVDADFYDNKNAFNFSEGEDDPYFNPLEWIYSLANQYVDDPFFLNEAILEHEDINLFRAFIQQKEPLMYEQFKDRLNDFKLSQLLDSACTSKQLIEDEDFIVRQITREVHGKTQTISEAHILVNHIEDKEATLSYGVQQALHDRLNKKYKAPIEAYKNGQLDFSRPPFSCDNQIDCIDSQNTSSYFKQFGKIIGTTGTAGTQAELQEAIDNFGIKNLLNMPPRKKSRLQYLPTLFTDKKASFFFGVRTQLQAIRRELAKHSHQPIMISCRNIEKAEYFQMELQKKYGDKVQIIHAKNADDPTTFERLVDEAKKPDKITIVTPLAGRGVDIKTTDASAGPSLNKAQKKLNEQAETLLVIETHLERYRNRNQLQGRTARDGKAGQTIGIFDLTDLADLHGQDIHHLSRQEKLDLLDKIVIKMDEEAGLERMLSTRVKNVMLTYEDRFDAQLKQAAPGSEQRLQLIAAKAQFIIEADKVWNELLAQSDPKGELFNPYIRYTDNKLHRKALDEYIIEYQKLMRDLYQTISLKAAVDDEDLPELEPEAKLDGNTIEEIKTTPLEETGESVILNTFIEYNKNKKNPPKIFSTYLLVMEQEKDFGQQLAFWVDKNPKTDAALKELAKKTEHARFIAAQSTQSHVLASIQSLSTTLQSLNNKNLTFLSQLIDFNTIVYQDLHLKLPLVSEKEFCKTTQELLTQAFSPPFSKLSQKDEAILTQLSAQILALPEQTPICDFQTMVSNLINATEHQINNKELGNYLESTKHYVATLARISLAEQEKKQGQTADPRKADVSFMVNQIKELLLKTHTRLNGSFYKKTHAYAAQKIESVNKWIKELSQPEFVADLLANHKTKSLGEILDHINNNVFVNNKSLLTTLSINTRSGESKELTKTTSGAAYARLQKSFNATFHFDNAEKGDELYLQKLKTILENLQARQKKAGMWKDIDLYKRKVDKLVNYIDKTKTLIHDKANNPAIDLNREIRSLLVRIKNDPDIYRSTARFFKNDSNVTVVKEITQLSEEMSTQRVK